MSDEKLTIPVIDVGPLFADDSAAWTAVDNAIAAAARTTRGFVVTGMPDAYQVRDEDVAQLHTFFSLAESTKFSLALQKYNPASSQMWRGYAATLKGGWAHNEFYDIGQEKEVDYPAIKGAEILAEPNGWPAEEPVPGWRAAMLARFDSMYVLSKTVLASLVRGLGADADASLASFVSGFSTLRLLNYPLRPAGVETGGEVDATRMHNGVEQPLLTVEHDDSCCLSVLWQDPDGGLQMQAANGEWLDVPKVPGAVSIHMGDAIEPLTNNQLKATPHRVLGEGGRQSMGFFLEPDLDAELTPFPGLPGADQDVTADTYALALLKVMVQRNMYTDLIELP